MATSSDDSASNRFRLSICAQPGRRVRYIAVDIECTGANVLKNKIIAVGVAWIDLHRDDTLTLSGTKLFTFPFDETKDFEKRCWDEFWSQQTHTLGLIRQHTEEQQTGAQEFQSEGDIWTKFRETIDFLCREVVVQDGKTGARGAPGKVCLVSDNPAYDIGRINVEMSRYGLHTLDYLPKDPADPTKYSYGSIRFTGTLMKLRKICKLLDHHQFEIPSIPFEHDHMPQNDAMTIAWKYACADQFLGLEA